MNEEALLSLRGVAKIYGRKLIFKNLSLSINPGERLLVLGHNGAGKSTLLKLMAGLASPTDGEIDWREDLRVAYLGHTPLLYPCLTAMENLRFWASASNADSSPEKLTAILAELDLLAHAHEPARVFSRGMAQRLNFARVFIQQAELLLLDEPLTGLDCHSRGIIHDRLQASRQEGAALVLVSHSPETDASLTDRVLALDRGKPSFCGNIADYRRWRDERETALPC